MKNTTVFSKLVKLVGEANLIRDQELKILYGKDQTHYIPNPLAIVFPEAEQQVIDIVNFANEVSLPLVPSGGRTGYSGGAVAQDQELVVSFTKMNRILDFNEYDKTVRLESGVITKVLQDYATQHNLFYPIEFASSGSSQLGGNIATNAGGIRVIRYGLTRNYVMGLKVVCGNGELLELNHGLIKNASGYDLRQLFIGSEGTLGFIIEATMKLIQKPSPRKVIMLAVYDTNSFSSILQFFTETDLISAFEFFSEPAINYVIKTFNISHLFSKPNNFYILIEYESDHDNDTLMTSLTEKCIAQKWVSDALIGETQSQIENLWRYREEISSSLRNFSPFKFDVAVIPSKVSNFMQAIDYLFKQTYPDFEIIWFGHVGDGNLHINILKPNNLSAESFSSICEKLSNEVYAIVREFKGSMSAEHGVGLAKKAFLSYTKSNDEINYMRKIKKIFDSNNIMNPGKIFSI